ncbi:MAG: helix-turn-helix transcriptional regulator [Cellulosilyticaceae bacterium]
MEDQQVAMRYLPLTELTYYILLAMTAKGKYDDIISRVSLITKGEVKLGRGTLYAATQKLLKDHLISQEEIVEEGEIVKYYVVTFLGEYIIKEEYRRLEKLVTNSHPTITSMI